VGSVAGDSAFPLQGIYCASKHAVKAFIETFRIELEADLSPISLTLVKPSSIGTPLQRQARNYLDKEPRLPSPLYAPEEVAHAILHAAVHPMRDINVGGAGRLLIAVAESSPRLRGRAGRPSRSSTPAGRPSTEAREQRPRLTRECTTMRLRPAPVDTGFRRNDR
jgi:short-subunit dehydrogenase